MQDNLQTLASSRGVSVHGGFPESALDLNQLLIQRPSSTYLFRVSGHTWADQGIYDGDIAVIDQSSQAGPRDLIVTWRVGGSTICRQHQLTTDDRPWGIVTAIIHQYR